MYKKYFCYPLAKFLILLGFVFSFYSCDVYVDRQKQSIPLVELSANKLIDVVIKNTANQSPRDKGFDYDFNKIKFIGNSTIKVPIKFRWTASKGTIFTKRLYCEAVGILTVSGSDCFFEPERGNENLKKMAPYDWMSYKYDAKLDYSSRLTY